MLDQVALSGPFYQTVREKAADSIELLISRKNNPFFTLVAFEMNEASDNVEHHLTGKDGISFRLVLVEIGNTVFTGNVWITCATILSTIEREEVGFAVH